MSPLPVTEHARLERVHAVAGLFEAVQKGQRPRREIVVPVDQKGLTETWRFTVPFALDASDQSVLLTIVAMMRQDANAMPIRAVNATRALSLVGEAASEDSLSLRTTAYRLASECGWAWGKDRPRLIQESLRRLSQVTFDVERNGVVVSGGTLIARAMTSDGRLMVAINPYLARALMDPNGALWAKMDLTERRALKSDTARLLHTWLCTWLRPGDSGRVRLNTLTRHIWPNEANGPIPEGTVRRRRHAIRDALREVTRLPGWHVSEPDDRNIVAISRPPDRVAPTIVRLRASSGSGAGQARPGRTRRTAI